MRRAMPVILCVLLLLVLLPVGSSSAPDTSNLIFTVIDLRLMSVRAQDEYLEPEKLSFYSGGTYYVWSGYFEYLSVVSKVNHNAERQTVTVYNISQSVFFDYSNNITMDKSGNTYDYGALWRGGQVFLPLSVVAQVFDLYYIHVPAGGGATDAIPAPLLYIASETPKGSDATGWGRQQSQRLSRIMNRYIQDLSVPEPQLPDDPVVPTTEPEQPPKLVYLTFSGPLDTERTPLVLQALEETLVSQPVGAAFFVPAQREALLESAGLLRRLYAQGYPIGLLLPHEGAEAALAEGNALLRKIIYTKTRLVSLEGGTESADPALLDALAQAGCRLWDANIVPDLSGQATAGNVNAALRNSLSRASGTAVLGLDSSALALETLPGLLTYLDSGSFSLLTIAEWDSPVNQAQVLN